MAKREEHLFQFPASKIAEAARAEAAYHKERLEHWQERQRVARERVESTTTVRLAEHPVTGGVRLQPVVNYGDPEAWQELQLAQEKIETHRREMERFESAEAVYKTQHGGDLDRRYDLDLQDVHYFRLGGEPRED